jgi:hypothetical protein
MREDAPGKTLLALYAHTGRLRAALLAFTSWRNAAAHIALSDAKTMGGPAMRTFVLFLALLAAAKLGYQEYLFRGSTRDTIVSAYKERAAVACQKDAKGLNLGITPQAWLNPRSVRLVIGKSSVDVYLWQLNDAMWNARYRNPYLFLSLGEHPGSVICEYDIVNAAASVYRM